jgi:cyclase
MTGETLSTAARLREVADGVFAYVQEPGGWCMSNSGVIAGRDGAVVIDTLATHRRTTQLRRAVDGLTSGSRRVLVNTHHHGDHTFGNHLFGSSAVVVAHELAVEEMSTTGLALTSLWPDVDWGDVRVTLPTVTFPDRLTLGLDDRRVELVHVGPAHTCNDVIAWLPAERVLFAGDVVLSGCTPFSLMGSIAGTLTAIDRLRDLAPTTIVCGHGPPVGTAVLDTNAAYLRWVQQVAAEGAAAGQTPLEAAREADLGDFAELLDPERIVGNLHRAYAELREGSDAPAVEVAPVFGEMVAFNGGRTPTCLA